MLRSLRLPPRTVNPPEPAGGYPALLMLISIVSLLALVVWAGATGRSLSPVTWYVARASGLALYLLLWLTVVLGMGIISGLFGRFGGRGLMTSVHAFVTRLSYAFLALHMLSLVIDQTLPFGLRQMVVPFSSTWHEPWTGFGVISAWLFILVGGSFAARRLIGFRAWRVLHALALPLYGIALLHGIGSGSDASVLWVQLTYAATAGTVFFLLIYRLFQGNHRQRSAMPKPRRPTDRLLKTAHTGDGSAHAHLDH
ncbi:MAG TPA: hypothetical protein VFL82_02825 [Thermomicrobiales bacterium]|nr:hypothetical protein [Thermomicrobiales bacterium]